MWRVLGLLIALLSPASVAQEPKPARLGQRSEIFFEGWRRQGGMFGLAVCTLPLQADDDTPLRFVVAEPFHASDGGALHVFEGAAPRRTRTLAAEPGHRIASDLRRVRFQGAEHLLAELYVMPRTSGREPERRYAVYSFLGERLAEYGPFRGTLVPLGDVEGDGTTDYWAAAEPHGLRWIDGSDGTTRRVFELDGACLPQGTIPDLDGDGLDEVVAWVPGAEHPLAIFASAGGEPVVLRWPGLRPREDPRLRVRASRTKEDHPARVHVVIGHPGWDWPKGRVAAFDAASGALVYEIEDELGDWMEVGDGRRYREGTMLGYALVVGPDLDGDGVPDVFTSAPASFLSATPKLLAFSGSTGERLWLHEPEPFDAMWTGTSLDCIPDQDGDGKDDLLVGGADISYTGGIKAIGSVRIHSSRDGKLLWELHELELE